MATVNGNGNQDDQKGVADATLEPQQEARPPPPWADRVDLTIKRQVNQITTKVDVEKEKVAAELSGLGGRADDTVEKKAIRFQINQLDGQRNKIRIYKGSGIVYDWISSIPGLASYDEVRIDNFDQANIRIRYPYGPIYHDKQRGADSKLFNSDLSKLSIPDRQHVEAFRVLCEDPLIKKYLAAPWSNGLTKDTEIKFEDVWKVYLPGSYVKVRTLNSQNSIRRISAINKGVRSENTKVSCLSLCWNGTSFREMRSNLKINEYSGTRKLDSFRGQPVVHPKQSRNDMLPWVRSGLQYCRYWAGEQVSVKEYEGIALPIPDSYDSNTDSEREGKDTEIIRGRIVIDPKAVERNSSLVKSYNLTSEDMPLWEQLPHEIRHLSSSDINELSYQQATSLTDIQWSQLAQCPAAIPAFSLAKDSWYLVVVKDLERPRYAGMQAWQSIVGSGPFKSKLEKLKSLVLAWSQTSIPANTKQLSTVAEIDEEFLPNGIDEKAGDPDTDEEKPRRGHFGFLSPWRRSEANEPPKPQKASQPRPRAIKPFPRRGEGTRAEPKPGNLKRRQSSALDNQGKPGDITRIDKGQGLVIMLYGPPGVGKTMTAECLADLIRKPLYRVDLGQIGSRDLEAEIDRVFKNAEHWNAVLLLDEAEAIMMERSPDKMDQNTWVSAFLRKIEYFRGILILTTNLIHLIDPAFESRITYAIEYTSMRDSDEIRLEVWTKFVNEIDYPPHSSRPSHRKIGEWSRQAVNLNARQIRNICHSAEVLAKNGHDSKSSSDFDRVQVKTVEQWIDNLLKDTDEFIGAIVKAKRETEEQYMRDLS